MEAGDEGNVARPAVVATEQLLGAQESVCGAAGKSMPLVVLKESLEVPKMAKVGVYSSVERLPVCIVDMLEPCSLSINFLTQSEPSVDSGWRLERVLDEEVPLPSQVGCAIRAAEGVVEPPEKELQLPGDVAVERSLVTAEESVTVLVANFSSKARENPSGAKLGTCMEGEMTAGSRKKERDGSRDSLWGCRGENRRRNRSL